MHLSIFVVNDPLCSSRSYTYRIRLFCESVDEDAKQLVGVVDLVGVLSNDPDEGRFRLWLIKLLEVGAQCWDDTLIRRGVFSEDVLIRTRGVRDRAEAGSIFGNIPS